MMTYNNFYLSLLLVPPKGESTGFKDCNQAVGHTWSSYTQDEQDIFSPKIFERLCQQSLQNPTVTVSTVTEEGDPINPLAATVTSTQEDTPLSPEQITKYMPIFKRLVNLKTVARDFKHSRLCRKSGKSQHLEVVAREELKKIVKQV